MKLSSFRELLVKKTEDAALGNLIHSVKDELLESIVLESLEKSRKSHKGDSAGIPIRDFGLEMDPETEPKMIHDALSHHASSYKAALKAGDQNLANQHANQLFRIMDMADQAQKHSQGKLQVDAVPPHPWERHTKTRRHTAEDKPVKNGNKKVGEFVTGTKGWRYRDAGKGFDFLQSEPHESSKNEVNKHGHNKAYPLEQISVNGKYLDIKDKDSPGKYEEHPFDQHPIMSHFEQPAGHRTNEDDAQWRKEHAAYAASPHMDKYFDRQEAEEKADPETYAKKGLAPSAPVHKDPIKPSDDISKTAESHLEDKQRKILDALPADMRSTWIKSFKGE